MLDCGRVECVVYVRKRAVQRQLALAVVMVGNVAHTSSQKAGRPMNLGEAMTLGAMWIGASSTAGGEGKERFRNRQAILGIAGPAIARARLGKVLSWRELRCRIDDGTGMQATSRKKKQG